MQENLAGVFLIRLLLFAASSSRALDVIGLIFTYHCTLEMLSSHTEPLLLGRASWLSWRGPHPLDQIKPKYDDEDEKKSPDVHNQCL
jgi:hypothetical protein